MAAEQNIPAHLAETRDVLDAFNNWMAQRGPLGAGASPERIFIAGWAAARRPSASIGEDGLPELPKPDADLLGDGQYLVWNRRQMLQYARDAIAADRRVREAAHKAEMAQWARDNGLNVPPQWTVAAPPLSSAQQAEKGEGACGS